MLALVATGRGVDVELREVPDPEPARDEALVAVRAASLNRGDIRALGSAHSGARPGWDLAGEVRVPAADGTSPPAGTRVAGIVRSGAWAECAAVRSDMMARLPDKVGFETAAALPIAGVTAWRALQIPGTIVDRRLLLTGASGGVGRFVIQLAFHLGAQVTAVVSSEERGEGLRELGADEVIVGMPEDDRPFDVILESIGGTYLARALELVDRRGWVVSFGASSGEPSTFDAGRFFRKGGARLQGLDVFEELECHRSGPIDLGYLSEEVERGALVVHIDIRTSWRDPKPAFDALLERRVQGKAVLIID